MILIAVSNPTKIKDILKVSQVGLSIASYSDPNLGIGICQDVAVEALGILGHSCRRTESRSREIWQQASRPPALQ